MTEYQSINPSVGYLNTQLVDPFASQLVSRTTVRLVRQTVSQSAATTTTTTVIIIINYLFINQ